MSNKQQIRSRVAAFTMLLVALVAAIGICALLWYKSNDDRVLVASIVLAAATCFSLYRSSKIFVQHSCLIRIATAIFGLVVCILAVVAPRYTDQGSSWNEAVKTMQMLQRIIKANEKYAATHQGSFAPSLAELHENTVMGRSYTILYEPIEDQDHMIRHYILRGIPGDNYWISIYADETGVVRESEDGPANQNSRAIL